MHLSPAACSIALLAIIPRQAFFQLLEDVQVADLAACEFEPGSASRVMLGRESGGLIVYDLEAQQAAAKVLGMQACCSLAPPALPLANVKQQYRMYTGNSTQHVQCSSRSCQCLHMCLLGCGQVASSQVVMDFTADVAIRLTTQADIAGGILMMRAPAGRGLVAIGNAAGQLVLTDPRAGTPARFWHITGPCMHRVHTSFDAYIKQLCVFCLTQTHGLLFSALDHQTSTGLLCMLHR